MKYLHFFLIICAFVMVGIFPAGAQQFPETQTTSGRIPVIIRMKQQFDTHDYAKRKLAGYSAEAKRINLMSSLKSFGLQAQKNILTSLKANEANREVDKIKQFWLSNIISCEATGPVIEMLKLREDVEAVIPDEEEKVFDYEINPDMKITPKANPDVVPSITMVRALEANTYGYTGKGIVVGLIDTGVNTNHEDIKNALWTTPEYPNHGWNFTNNNDNTNDIVGHGSHCAGTILGNGKAGKRTGVAPEAQLMILKVTDSDATIQSKILSAIEFATENGANVLSMSLGFQRTSNNQKKMWREVMENLLEFNILAVIAAGNEGEYLSSSNIPNNVRLPGSCPAAWIHPEQMEKGGTSSVITIGSLKENGYTKAESSSVGPVTWQKIETYDDYPYNPGMGLIKPDIAAPGENIISLNWKNNTGYVSMSGTSMATPCVAGIAAAVLSKNPELTPAEIVRIISESSVKINPVFNNQTGAGRADALLATLYAPNADLNCTDLIIDETSGVKNGVLNYGDEADITFSYNSGLSEDLTGYQIEVVSLSPQVSLELNTSQLPVIKAGTKTDLIHAYHLKLLPKVDTLIDLAVIIRKDNKIWTNLFRIPVIKPKLQQEAMQIKEIRGNGNGIIEAGEKAEFTFPVKSIGKESCRNVKVEIDNESPYLVFSETDHISFAEISGTDKVVVECEISKDTPEWHTAEVGLKLIGDNIDTTLYYKIQVGKQAILIVDKTKSKLSSKALASYLKLKNITSFSMADAIDSDPEVLKANHSVWIFAGTYPDLGTITADENQQLARYLEEGGNLYIEGGSFWHDENNTVNKYFNIKYETFGDQISTIVGCVPGYNEDFSVQYTSVIRGIDHISPIAPAYAFYKNKTPEFITTVAHNAGKYKTIGSSFELAGILSNIQNSSVLNTYLDFLQIMDMPITGIESTRQNSKLDIACFKSENDLLIRITAPENQSAVICLYNSNGQLIDQIKENITNHSTIRFSGINENGIYFIKVNAGEESIARKVLF